MYNSTMFIITQPGEVLYIVYREYFSLEIGTSAKFYLLHSAQEQVKYKYTMLYFNHR